MSKWKYLKGSEKDFEGAPDWATIRERMNDSREYFVERYECDKRYTNAIHKGDEFRFLVNDFGTGSTYFVAGDYVAPKLECSLVRIVEAQSGE